MKAPLLFLLAGQLWVSGAFAEQALRPAPSDSRIFLATYRDSEVYKIVASYGFQTTIEFSEKETVETISIGDSIAWQVVPAGHRVFLKPQEQNAVTNMTVVTSLRPYYFELGAKKNSNPASVTFLLRFTYPDASPTVLGVRSTSRPATVPARKPSDYNFNYTLTGSREIAPLRVFDDGEFTYMQFKALTDLPAIFLVGKDKQESVVNYRVEGPYVVIERIANQFSLRHGSDVACVYNRSTPTAPPDTASSDRSPLRAAKAESP
ncbi:MAG: P-type conjugative transfer protein VirB9 [Burkholderiales bacterium]|nr:P-type conjugative transfer protein VirB9 [Burkholderiales bacterium]